MSGEKCGSCLFELKPLLCVFVHQIANFLLIDFEVAGANQILLISRVFDVPKNVLDGVRLETFASWL